MDARAWPLGIAGVLLVALVPIFDGLNRAHVDDVDPPFRIDETPKFGPSPSPPPQPPTPRDPCAPAVLERIGETRRWSGPMLVPDDATDAFPVAEGASTMVATLNITRFIGSASVQLRDPHGTVRARIDLAPTDPSIAGMSGTRAATVIGEPLDVGLWRLVWSVRVVSGSATLDLGVLYPCGKTGGATNG